MVMIPQDSVWRRILAAALQTCSKVSVCCCRDEEGHMIVTTLEHLPHHDPKCCPICGYAHAVQIRDIATVDSTICARNYLLNPHLLLLR